MGPLQSISTITGQTRVFARDGLEGAPYQSSLTLLSASGKPAEETRYWPSGGVQTKRVFDSAGLLREQIVYNQDGTSNYRYEVEHDENGRELERVMLLGGGAIHGRWSSSYDEDGLLAERVWYNRDGVGEVAERYEYDDARRLRRKVRGNVAEWKYFYDADGRMVRETGGYFSSDEPSQSAYEYDEQGRVKTVTELYATGGVRSITTFEYAP